MPPTEWLACSSTFEGPRYLRIAHIQRLLAEGILTPDLRRRRCFPRVPRSQAAE